MSDQADRIENAIEHHLDEVEKSIEEIKKDKVYIHYDTRSHLYNRLMKLHDKLEAAEEAEE